jgi:hypothetical protein
VVRKAFVLIALLCSCRTKPAVDPAELERLRVEQKALRDRIDALQAKVAELNATPRPGAAGTPSPASVPAPDSAPIPLPPPTTRLRAPDVAVGSTLHTEDLHGSPVAGSLLPQAQDGVPSAEAAQLLQQLQGDLEQVKKNQAQQQSALDEIEKMK